MRANFCGIQEKTADKSFSLHPVATIHNVAHPDIATKTLSRQRLFYLLHSCGLMYGVDFSEVGENELSLVNEKVGQCAAAQEDLPPRRFYVWDFAMGIT